MSNLDSKKLLKEYISLILEAQEVALGPEQSIGFGKNKHSVNTEPFTWENYPDLQYDVVTEPDGSCLASVDVLSKPELSTGVRKFADEETAMAWVRNNFEELHRKLLNNPK